jgi:tRNA(Ile)-lysidine synthetase-like protein
VIRTRRENDRIVLHGEKIHRRIRKLHNARKIPPYLRETAVVIADDKNILWEEYCGVSECAYAGNTATDERVYDIFITKRPADDLSDG